MPDDTDAQLSQAIFDSAADEVARLSAEIETLSFAFVKSLQPQNANKFPSEYLTDAEKAALNRAQERVAGLAR